MRAFGALTLALFTMAWALSAAAESPTRWHSTTTSELEAAETLRALELGLDADVPDSLSRHRAMLEVFHHELSPYGAWHSHPAYGLIWVPSPYWVGAGFGPYLTHGHWGLDASANWVWMSEYRFGHVVFHYGRWLQVAGFGWAWVPGFDYAPAWVVWRVPTAGVAYFAWAPLPPREFWQNGALVHGGYAGYNPWLFCPSAQAFSPHVSRHVRSARRHRQKLLGETRQLPESDSGAGPSLEQARVPKYRVPARIFSPPPSRRMVGARVLDALPKGEISGDLAEHDRPVRGDDVRRRDTRLQRAPAGSREFGRTREFSPRRTTELRRVTTLPAGPRRGSSVPVRAPASRERASGAVAGRDRELAADRFSVSDARSRPRRAATPRAEQKKAPRSVPRRATTAPPRRAERPQKRQQVASEPAASEDKSAPPRKRPAGERRR